MIMNFMDIEEIMQMSSLAKHVCHTAFKTTRPALVKYSSLRAGALLAVKTAQ